MSIETLGHGLTGPEVKILQEYNAKEKERRLICTHAGYNFKEHGRCCHTCGTFMVDFGD